MLDLGEALQLVDISRRSEVYHACRAFLVHRHEDLSIFDRAFDAFWRGRLDDEQSASVRLTGTEEAPAHKDEVVSRPEGTPAERERWDWRREGISEGERSVVGRLYSWSDVARLAVKDFAEFTASEIALARAAFEHLEWTPGERRTRRWIPGPGSQVDVRRALRRSLRTGGEVVRLSRRQRRVRPRSIVLLCDISGSMERYSRMLLHFAHGLARRHRRLEAFLFSTRLTRVTAELRARRPDHAVAAVARVVPDWSGGTRIGEAIREFHQRWRRRVLHGGPVVLLISDGWDRGDPQVLQSEIARLQRSCHRLVWLNPLIGTPGYAPLTRGLRCALPFVDDFLPARTLNNLVDLTRRLNTLPARARGRR
jgi:uncharacterized protein with von Willebrand factor type A (vWA) domain